MHTPMLLDEWIGSRHEESDANHAHELAKDGNHSLLHSIRHIQDRDFSLSKKGKQRAPHIGAWLERSGLLPFDVYMVSEYVRAHETTQLMNLRGAIWIVDPRLNERQWGADGQLSSHEREALRPDWKKEKEGAPYDWRPEGGETLREKMAAFARVDRRIRALRFSRSSKIRFMSTASRSEWHDEHTLFMSRPIRSLSGTVAGFSPQISHSFFAIVQSSVCCITVPSTRTPSAPVKAALELMQIKSITRSTCPAAARPLCGGRQCRSILVRAQCR